MSYSSWLVCEKYISINGFLISSFTLILILSLASYPRNTLSFTAGKHSRVWNRHANCRHQKTIIFVSTVFMLAAHNREVAIAFKLMSSWVIMSSAGIALSLTDDQLPVFTRHCIANAPRSTIETRAVKSNRFRFDSIFDREVAETIRYDPISIRYRFDSKNNSIRYKAVSAVMKENRQSEKWSILKRIIHNKGINIWQSALRFCFQNFSFFFLSQLQVFLVQVMVKIESNRIVLKIKKKKPKKKTFDSIWIRFDSIWRKNFDSMTKYDSISIRFDSPDRNVSRRPSGLGSTAEFKVYKLQH